MVNSCELNFLKVKILLISIPIYYFFVSSTNMAFVSIHFLIKFRLFGESKTTIHLTKIIY